RGRSLPARQRGRHDRPGPARRDRRDGEHQGDGVGPVLRVHPPAARRVTDADEPHVVALGERRPRQRDRRVHGRRDAAGRQQPDLLRERGVRAPLHGPADGARPRRQTRAPQGPAAGPDGGPAGDPDVPAASALGGAQRRRRPGGRDRPLEHRTPDPHRHHRVTSDITLWPRPAGRPSLPGRGPRLTRMWRYAVQKLILAIPTVLAVVAFVFVSIRLVPGDPAVIMAGDFADAATLDRMREEWGLNRPLPVQFGVFVGNLVQGDLGNSIRSRQPVLRELGSRLQVTFTLALGSILVTLLIGLVAGIASAVRPYTVVDYTSTVVSLLGVSMPIFWSGLILIVIFSLYLDWFPTGGVGTWKHYVLPSVSLGVFSAGVVARQTRSAMLESLATDFVRTARSKGLPPHQVVL